MSIEAMKQALEAMEFANDTCIRNIGIGIIDISVITSLRAAIEQMEKAEPVAWLHARRSDSDVITDKVKRVWGGVAVGREAQYTIPLFTHPAPTSDEITKLREQLAATQAEVEALRKGAERYLDDA